MTMPAPGNIKSELPSSEALLGLVKFVIESNKWEAESPYQSTASLAYASSADTRRHAPRKLMRQTSRSMNDLTTDFDNSAEQEAINKASDELDGLLKQYPQGNLEQDGRTETDGGELSHDFGMSPDQRLELERAKELARTAVREYFQTRSPGEPVTSEVKEKITKVAGAFAQMKRYQDKKIRSVNFAALVDNEIIYQLHASGSMLSKELHKFKTDMQSAADWGGANIITIDSARHRYQQPKLGLNLMGNLSIGDQEFEPLMGLSQEQYHDLREAQSHVVEQMREIANTETRTQDKVDTLMETWQKIDSLHAEQEKYIGRQKSPQVKEFCSREITRMRDDLTDAISCAMIQITPNDLVEDTKHTITIDRTGTCYIDGHEIDEQLTKAEHKKLRCELKLAEKEALEIMRELRESNFEDAQLEGNFDKKIGQVVAKQEEVLATINSSSSAPEAKTILREILQDSRLSFVAQLQSIEQSTSTKQEGQSFCGAIKSATTMACSRKEAAQEMLQHLTKGAGTAISATAKPIKEALISTAQDAASSVIAKTGKSILAMCGEQSATEGFIDGLKTGSLTQIKESAQHAKGFLVKKATKKLLANIDPLTEDAGMLERVQKAFTHGSAASSVNKIVSWNMVTEPTKTLAGAPSSALAGGLKDAASVVLKDLTDTLGITCEGTVGREIAQGTTEKLITQTMPKDNPVSDIGAGLITAIISSASKISLSATCQKLATKCTELKGAVATSAQGVSSARSNP